MIFRDGSRQKPSGKKLRIAFDASCLVTHSKSGVAYYTEGLIAHLARDYEDQIELIGHYCNFGGRNTVKLPQSKNISYRQTKIIPNSVLNLLRRFGVWLPFEFLIKTRADFHLFPAFIGWPSIFNTPSAPVIHDLTYINFPQYVSGKAAKDLRKYVPLTMKIASFIITISRASEASLRHAYGSLNKPVLITYIPPVGLLKISGVEADDAIKELGIDSSFILFLGNIEPRKNLVGLLNAYSLLSDNTREQYGLVLAGGSGWQDEEILEKIKSLRDAGSKIYQTGYVSDEQRSALYMKATVFVLPSHYEGFGMPLLEAITYQTPMLVSNIAALKEIAKDSALYCDPNSHEDIATKLQRLLTDKSLQEQLVEKGNQRLKDFSWQKVTKDLYEQIVKAVS